MGSGAKGPALPRPAPPPPTVPRPRAAPCPPRPGATWRRRRRPALPAPRLLHRRPRAIRPGSRGPRSPDTGTSHGRGSVVSSESPHERRRAQRHERPAPDPLEPRVPGRSERCSADARDEPARRESERALVHFVQRREDEREGEGAQRAQAGRDATARRESLTALRIDYTPGAGLTSEE